ncbi:MAG: YciI family protein [Candidatus Dormibacteria bacterium]
MRVSAGSDSGELWLVTCRDAAGSEERRRLLLDDHRKYVDEHADGIVFSGPLVADDGGTRTGQVFVIRVQGRAAAEAFVEADPLATGGVFGSIDVSRVLPRFRDGERCAGWG